MRKVIQYILWFIISTLIIICLIRYKQYKECLELKDTGSKLIQKIELYCESYHKLPNSLSDINEIESMGIGPHYNKIDKNNFEVYFCLGFDEYFIYSSKSKEWHYE